MLSEPPRRLGASELSQSETGPGGPGRSEEAMTDLQNRAKSQCDSLLCIGFCTIGDAGDGARSLAALEI